MDALKRLKKKGEGAADGRKNKAIAQKILFLDQNSTNNPWIVFVNLKDFYYRTTIKNFINETLWRKTDPRVLDSPNVELIDEEYINMFNYLLNLLPWWQTKSFLASCARNKKEVLNSFSDFIQTPEIQEYKNQTQAFLLRRKSNKLNIKEREINKSRLPYIFEKYFDYFVTKPLNAQIPPPLVRTAGIRVKTMKNTFGQPIKIKQHDVVIVPTGPEAPPPSGGTPTRPPSTAEAPQVRFIDQEQTNLRAPAPPLTGTQKRAALLARPLAIGATKCRNEFYNDNLFNECNSQYFYAPWVLFKNIRGFAISNPSSKYATNLEIIDQFGTKWYKANKLFYKESCANIREFEPGAVGYIETISTTAEGGSKIPSGNMGETDNIRIIIETSEIFEFSKKEWLSIRKSQLAQDSFMIAKRLLQNNSVLNTSLSSKDLEKYTDDIIESFKPCVDNEDLAKKLSYVLVFLNKIINTPQQYHVDIKNKLYKGSSLITLDKNVLLPEIYLSESDKPKLIDEITFKISIARLWIESEFFLEINKLRPHVLYTETGTQEVPLRIMTKPLKLKKDRHADFAPGLIQKLKTLIYQNKGCFTCFKDLCGHSVYRSFYQGGEVVFCDSGCMEKFGFNSKTSPVVKLPEESPGNLPWPPPRKYIARQPQ
jgi:hypothetical protein